MMPIRHSGWLAAAAFAAVGLTALAPPTHAHHDGEIVEAQGIRASHAHMSAPASASHGASVYLTIENEGAAEDRLVAVSSPVAASAWIEASVLGADGALAVKTITALTVAPGQTLVFQPGAMRLVLSDLNQTLAPGDHFPLTLTFQNAGALDMIGEVEHDHDGDHHHGHDADHDHGHGADEPAS